MEFKKAKKCIDTKDIIEPIPRATMLKRGGVKFKKAKQSIPFAIQFSNRILEMSLFTIEDEIGTFCEI